MTIGNTTVGTKKFAFRIEITGIGDTPEEAWLDATEAFSQNSGTMVEPLYEQENTDTYMGYFHNGY